MAISTTGLLHTKSSYAQNISGISLKASGANNAKIKSNIAALKNKELNTYQRLFPKCSSIDDFIKQLRDLFDDNDTRFFTFFENANLRVALEKQFGFTKGGAEVIIEIKNPDKGIDLSKFINSPDIKIEGKAIHLGSEVEQVKKNLNTILNSKRFRGKSTQTIKKLFKNTSELGQYLFDGALEVSSVKGTTFSETIVTPGSIFSYTAEDIRAAKDDPEIKKELLSAKNQIKKFIQSESGYNAASSEMKQAFQTTWNQNIESEFSNMALFEKGGVVKAIVGAFGEFQMALLYEYISRKIGNSPIGKAIISDTLKKGEQSKADVTILDDIGIQVKNFNSFTAQLDSSRFAQLKVNTHPSKFVDFFPSLNSNNFFEFLANYFFNKSFQSQRQNEMNTFQEELQQAFAEVANLAVDQFVEDTVAFYFIEGKYFVPGSAILEAYYSQNSSFSKSDITVTGPTSSKILSDEQFKEVDDYGDPLWEEYWFIRGKNWYVTAKHDSRFNELLEKDISFRSKFDYTTIPNMKRYSLF